MSRSVFLAGLEHAKGDAVVLMYADMQDPPEIVNEMLARWRNGADIVHGVRKRRVGESRFEDCRLAHRLPDNQ